MQLAKEYSPNFIYDEKSKKAISKHRSNFYRDGLLVNRVCAVSGQVFELSNQLQDETPFYSDINSFVGFEALQCNSKKNPLTATAVQLIEDSDLTVEESEIYKYQQRFKPATYGEVYRLMAKNKLHLLPQTAVFHPWVHPRPSMHKSAGLFGPKHKTSTEQRLIRIRNLVNNIREFGYIPSFDDIIEGYMLIRGDEFRFLITAGHHRASVLAALNLNLGGRDFEKILCKYDTQRVNVKIVDINTADRWPGVASQYASLLDSVEMFNSFFD